MMFCTLLTLAILWNLILPRSGRGSGSPEITSNRSINFNPKNAFLDSVFIVIDIFTISKVLFDGFDTRSSFSQM